MIVLLLLLILEIAEDVVLAAGAITGILDEVLEVPLVDLSVLLLVVGSHSNLLSDDFVLLLFEIGLSVLVGLEFVGVHGHDGRWFGGQYVVGH